MIAANRLNQMRMGMFLLHVGICHLSLSLMSILNGALRVGIRAEKPEVKNWRKDNCCEKLTVKRDMGLLVTGGG